jgi:hypothetical protein
MNEVTLAEFSFTATINAPIDGSIMFTCCLTRECGSGKYLHPKEFQRTMERFRESALNSTAGEIKLMKN